MLLECIKCSIFQKTYLYHLGKKKMFIFNKVDILKFILLLIFNINALSEAISCLEPNILGLSAKVVILPGDCSKFRS